MEGRGSVKGFQYFGLRSVGLFLFSYTPRSTEGAKNPKLKDTLCYGWNLSGTPVEVLQQVNGRIQLKWLIQAYKLFPA